jgi:hypothetical protein
MECESLGEYGFMGTDKSTRSVLLLLASERVYLFALFCLSCGEI